MLFLGISRRIMSVQNRESAVMCIAIIGVVVLARFVPSFVLGMPSWLVSWPCLSFNLCLLLQHHGVISVMDQTTSASHRTYQITHWERTPCSPCYHLGLGCVTGMVGFACVRDDTGWHGMTDVTSISDGTHANISNNHISFVFIPHHRPLTPNSDGLNTSNILMWKTAK